MNAQARWKRYVGVAVFVFTWSLTTHGKYSSSGDEPHYLMISESLLMDGDLDLANNYRERQADRFGAGDLDHGAHARPALDGRLMSVHDIGVGVALVPLHAVARGLSHLPPDSLLRRARMTQGLFAYSIVSVGLIALTAWAFAQLAAGLMTATHSTTAAMLVIALGVSPPVLSHSFLVFPEVFALAVTCLAVWFTVRGDKPGDDRVLLLLAALIGLLPWTHRKYSPFVLGLAFLIVWHRWPTLRSMSRRQHVSAALLFIVPHAAFHAWTVLTWGALGGPHLMGGSVFGLTRLADGLPGMWLDRRYGLVAYAPLYWLLPVAVLLTWRRTWPFLVPAALLYLPLAAFMVWWGGFSPAARFLVPIVPLAAVPLAEAMRHRPMRIAFLVLLVPQLVVNAAVWQHPRWLWPVASWENPALHNLGPLGRAYERSLPSIKTTLEP